MQHKPRFGKVAQTDIPSPHFTFFLYPFSVFSGRGGFFLKKYPSGVWGSAPHIHFSSCRSARRSPLRPFLQKFRTDRHSVATPFSFTLFRFFRVLRVFFQKNPKRGVGQRPTYTFSLMSEREAEPRINHYLDTRQVCIDIHSSAAPCLFPLPQSGFFGSRGLFPKKVPERGVGQRPTYTHSFMSEREAEPRI